MREKFGWEGAYELAEGCRQEEGHRQKNKREESVKEAVGEKARQEQEAWLLDWGPELEQGLGPELQQELKLEWVEA